MRRFPAAECRGKKGNAAEGIVSWRAQVSAHDFDLGGPTASVDLSAFYR